ncbi:MULTISPECIES: S-layer homology domain-containing protein [unclassified Paenibacillus]|uniref:S-layer homology domain-containing protein n=1 Tax=unclassified Paenibacillus TaxID=185978 RepID=UPI001AE7CA1F|nr:MULTISPECIES: S-layer homology domain-containing protein [unclassified Paenibacillus]MBP1155313.1 hypothetical protein [Paenibacillus sp. PvP091]MBP1169303.1 hypothetical protein [Paenibacillus sp. PvR098]MBP2440331.1 hypothetical protein [Paenibacillus sp. PvP052]
MKTKKQRQAKRLAAAVLALSLTVSGSAFAEQTGTGVSARAGTTVSAGVVQSFSDVSPQHWAIKHITKLASIGIIQGYERAEYRPENSVSQQDVIVMAIRMMGLEDQALDNQTATVLPILVSDYAKPYVAYAFDKGLILTQEEAADTTSKTAWGSREATREWVAKLVIRAIGREDLARQQAASPSTFTDAKNMSDWANGYINAAAELQIVQGFEDNGFQPQGKVTRAQMATFLSRADKELTTRSERVSIGYVMELTDRKISVLNHQGTTNSYTISAGTVIYNAKDDTRIPLSTIKLTNEVYVVHNQGGALYVELTSDQEQMETYEGTLGQTFLDQMMLSVQQGTQSTLYKLASNVTITDASGRGFSLGSIEPGSILELKRNKLLQENEISHIIVKQAPLSKTAEGTVLNINTDQKQITFLEQTTGLNETYPFPALATVTMPDGTITDLSRLRVGDSVTYNIKSNEAVSVTIRKQADVTQAMEGSLESLSDDKKIMTVKKSGGTTLGAYFIADNAVVSIEGLPNASLFDIETGDTLKLDLVNDKVVKVNVTSRSVKQYVFATIIGYDADRKLLTIEADNGEFGVFRLTDSTAIKFGDATLPVSNFQSMFLTNTGNKRKVDLKVSKDKVVQVQLTQYVEGTVSQINSTTNEMTIRTVGGQNLTFKAYSSIKVELLNKPNGAMADLKVGDSIRANVNVGDQTMITDIVMKQAGMYKVLYTTPSSRQVNVKDENGSMLTFTVDSNDKIINPGKTSHAFEDIQVDEYIKASFNGIKLENVTLLNTLRGKVTGVDATLGTVTVQDFQGNVQVLPLGSQFTIKLNGTVSAAITSLKPNDRVEWIRDANEKITIHVATASNRVISSYLYEVNQLILKPTGGNDKTSYSFFAKAYLHKGNQTVAANAFMENEEVTIYVLDDKIIEIERP